MTNSQHMTYGMPVLTEEQRRERIKIFSFEISRLKSKLDATQTEDSYFSGGDLWALQAFEIALAALEAEPFAYARRLVRIRDGCVEAYKITQTLAENTEGLIYRNEVEPLYKALPVPVMEPVKLPSIQWKPCYCIDCEIAYDRDDVITAIKAAGYEVQE